MRLTIKKRKLKIQGNPVDTTILAAFHRCKQSCAPTIATGHHRTVRGCILTSDVLLSLFFVVSAVIPEKYESS